MYVTSPNPSFDADPIVVKSFLDLEDNVRAQCRTIAAGQMLFCEGDESSHVYEVVSGVVRSTKVLCDGRRQIIAFGYPGDLLGISHDCRYHADCEAVSEVQVRVHRKNACSVSVTNEPQFCNRLLRHAAAEISNMQEHFMMLGRKSAIEKVASFLVVLLDRVGTSEGGKRGFNLPMSRADIADFLGLTIETVSRTLTKLRKQGTIDLPNPHQVDVLRTNALRALAERDE